MKNLAVFVLGFVLTTSLALAHGDAPATHNESAPAASAQPAHPAHPAKHAAKITHKKEKHIKKKMKKAEEKHEG